MSGTTPPIARSDGAITSLHADLDVETSRLSLVHAERLECRRGCSSCCVDALTVFEVEAETIRLHHRQLLATGVPHAVGRCAFLDAEGACRIYRERPYVCRTQGLPLRWLDEHEGHTVERRDICPLNETSEAIEALPEADCFTLGVFEERLATLQLSRAAAQSSRTSLRALFARQSSKE